MGGSAVVADVELLWLPQVKLGAFYDQPVQLCLSKQGPGSHQAAEPLRPKFLKSTVAVAVLTVLGDGVITHGQRGTNRPPLGTGGYELWVKGPNLGIMAKVSYGSWT